MASVTKGNCYLCGAEIGKAAMKNHLLKKHDCEAGQLCAVLKAEGAYDKGYWLYVDVPVNRTLEAVDSFLRGIWLECCNHMSGFRTKKEFWDEDTDMGKAFEVGSFKEGTQLIHEYDYGSTTETLVTFMGTIKRPPQKEDVRLLARNVPPKFVCGQCGAEAAYIDPLSMWDSENPFYCEKCVKEYGNECCLPVTNSPRMGVCGYCGERDKFAFSKLPFGDERP